MTLFELQDWLGTTSAATQHYAKMTPTKLAESYADAWYFKRNDAELAAVNDGIVARDNLIGKLAEGSTPGSPTPRELQSKRDAGMFRESYSRGMPRMMDAGRRFAY
jgi:hypothetical protein